MYRREFGKFDEELLRAELSPWWSIPVINDAARALRRGCIVVVEGVPPQQRIETYERPALDGDR